MHDDGCANSLHSHGPGGDGNIVSYKTVLETYTLEEILELNDITPEECLEFLVEEGFLELPKIKPLDFDD